MILYVSDIHVWHTNPRSRLDDYKESCLHMLEKVGQCAKKHRVEAILLGGDVGHDTDWPISLFHEVREIMCEWPCPVYTAVGNHDMDNYALETYKRRGLGALEQVGVLEVGDLVEIGQDWRVEFFHAGQPKAKQLMAGAWHPERVKDGRVEVAVAHIPVGPYSVGTHIVGVDKLFVPFFDLLCVADIHMRFKPRELITGCTVLNPGPLERRSIAEKDEGGRVALIDKDKTIRYIDLGAPKASVAFIQKAEKELESVLGINFLETMEKIRTEPGKPVEDQIREMALLLHLDEEPVNRLLQEVNNARKA